MKMRTMQGSLEVSRRRLIVGGSASMGIASLPYRACSNTVESRVGGDIRKYYELGGKASGGFGDNAVGEWFGEELSALGYAIHKHYLDVPAFDSTTSSLQFESHKADLIPQAPVITTPSGGLTRPLYISGGLAVPSGIALINLPHDRRSSVVGAVEQLVRNEVARGASGAVLVTNGPTGEACALNTPLDRPPFSVPVGVLAPKDVSPFLAAAQCHNAATFDITGRSFKRPAFNLVARLDRKAAKTVIISTPRSGWFRCVGERGPGIAAWLEIARWAASANLPVNVELIATTAHEYEQAGGVRYIDEVAPRPEKTALWLHLGANLAAPDWHEWGGRLFRMVSADPQRFLVASPDILKLASDSMKGLAGLENVYVADEARLGGETLHVFKSGYKRFVGEFGAHRYHHTVSDDMRCFVPGLVEPVTAALINMLSSIFRA